jgi:hypothetical protein
MALYRQNGGVGLGVRGEIVKKGGNAGAETGAKRDKKSDNTFILPTKLVEGAAPFHFPLKSEAAKVRTSKENESVLIFFPVLLRLCRREVCR